MAIAGSQKIFILYIPGMDLRYLSPRDTPFLSQAFQQHSWATIETQPSPEQLSTVITGMNPHDHGVFQMKLLEPAELARKGSRLWEKAPDLLTTTYQCVRHQFCRDCDVPTIPPARRKSFEMHRLKFHGRRTTADLLQQLGDADSIASYLGPGRFEYSFTDRLADFDTVPDRAATGDRQLEFLQLHALDMMGHWVLKTPEKRAAVYKRADKVIGIMSEKCRQRGIAMFAVSDHGQEPVTATIDVRRQVRELDIDPAEFGYYLQPITARFWFHTESARQRITTLFDGMPNGTALRFWELEKFDIKFPTASYGELFFIADPGFLFFPHDFHHPLVNLVFGLKDSQQRSRVFNPLHTAYHGYLPHHDSEKGWIVSLTEDYALRSRQMKLVDLMPSMLHVMGEKQPGFMSGQNQIS